MNVIIDGVQYVPIPPAQTDASLSSALDVRFNSDVGDNVTVRDFLRELLDTLWMEAEGFSGKRPFGNSGWQFDIYAALIRAGYIDGTLDVDGCVEDIDTATAEKYVQKLIIAAFNGVDK